MADTLTSSPFTFEEAKALLTSAHRDTLGDHVFGDAEVGWMLEGREVATGYFGKSSNVTVLGDSSHSNTSFTGDEARQLRQMYKSSEFHRNDEG